MKDAIPIRRRRVFRPSWGAGWFAACFAAALPLAIAAPPPTPEPTDLADQPLRVVQTVPANVMLTPSVEWPTGNVQAYNDEIVNGCPGRHSGYSVCYFDPIERASRTNAANASNPQYVPVLSLPYIGYFDPYKCYQYLDSDSNTDNHYFDPISYTAGYDPTADYKSQPNASRATCVGAWSGNFLNWATSQTIDIFRWAMTGGDRWIDTTTTTVLEKARHDGSGGTAQFPVKRIGVAWGGIPVTSPSAVAPAPYSLSPQMYVSISGRNTRMLVASDPGLTTNAAQFFVRVRVCDKVLRETVTTCTRYAPPGDPPDHSAAVVFKPTGLIQENAMLARFGIMGYLLDNDPYRDGGVLRARMKFVGPTEPQPVGEATNPRREWDPTTGIYVTNPDPSDASTTNSNYGLSGANAITQSGVIQYLNKFGRRAGYKSYDTVSEMFYEALRYYRNVGPTPEYTNMGLTPGAAVNKVDGFPVITSWDDPIAPPSGYAGVSAWCPKNFFVGIGDSATHKDKRLPGNTDTTWESAAQPSNPDSAYSVVTLLNEIIASELANEGVTLQNQYGAPLTAGVANCCHGSAYIASLAYYANTRDIRPDGPQTHTKGKQTVKTYWVDVREAGSWGTGVPRTDLRRRNQYWLAAKYGGFRDLNDNGRLDAGDAHIDENRDGLIDVRDVWDKNGDLLPDNYFEADAPEALVDGLVSAFKSIRAEIASGAAVGISTRSVELRTDSGIYRVLYDPGSWSGSVHAFRYLGMDHVTGNVDTEFKWDAAEKIAEQDWDIGRRIVTMRSNLNENVPLFTGATPFRWGNLTPQQKIALNNDPLRLEWLRGRNDIPGTRLRTFRDHNGNVKPAVLGDIVDSEARYVGKPISKLSDAYNPGYAAFKAAHENRRGVLYVGANDGMLHAIDADIDGPNGGTEIFAYVPSFTFNGPNGNDVDGLLALTQTNYAHKYYVNSTPWIGDVDFGRTLGLVAAPDWRTVLIGGMGKGGQGYFAIDITDPNAFDSEFNVAGKVLWEFTDPDMGYSYGSPQVVKTRRWGWVVLLTSGHNNVKKSAGLNKGKGFLYVVDVKTGVLLEKIGTNTGSSANPSGFTQVTAYVPDAGDGTVSEVYGGDLFGNLWRFDFTGAGFVPAPTKIAQLSDAGGNPQPITAGPVVRAAPLTRNRYVFVGTGRLLGQSDVGSAQQQAFYAIRDGSRLEPWRVGNFPPGVSFPITRSMMVQNPNLLKPIANDPTRPAGWFYQLPNAGERVIIDAVDTDIGKIAWLGSIPTPDNPCDPQQSSRIYVANFETGQSQLYDPVALQSGNLARITSYDPQAGIVGLRLARVSGNIRAVLTGQSGELRLSQELFRYLNPRTMNWREVTDPGL